MLDTYVNSRLILLKKDPGVRPIDIGEVLRSIVGKVISKHAADKTRKQTCADHGAGAEAAIHSMKDIFEDEGTDAILLIDTFNAFNRLNRTAAMLSIQFTCPKISTYIINTYRQPSRLFITGGDEILSQEGATQADSLAMP